MSTDEEKQTDDSLEQTTPDSESASENASVDSAFAEENAPAENAEPTVESLQAELADAEKRVLLAHADLENFRRRNRREMQDQLRYASLGLMNDVLESVDNLQRAVESYEKDANGDGLVEGVKLVAQQINTVLQNNGCKKIEAVGQTFDPNLHQALQMQPSEEHEANIVMMDLRPGFQLHDRVIRPSQVFVSTGPENK
jgi:molecular chaperone GrpE